MCTWQLLGYIRRGPRPYSRTIQQLQQANNSLYTGYHQHQPQQLRLQRTRTMAQKASPNKLKILCLHGFLQSGEVFRTRIGSTRKALKSKAEFFFIDGPVEVTDEEAESVGITSRDGGRAWWKVISPTTTQDQGDDFQPAYDTIQAAVKETKPDILLGFSMGASAIGLFLSRASQWEPELLEGISGCILFSGFLPKESVWAEQVKLKLPAITSLHLYGKADSIVDMSRSKAVMEAYREHGGKVEVFEHDGGHLVPSASGALRDSLRAFLSDLQS
eukprot:m.339173 g.339173  ORF g.339173 m.339173 type:complete len:274 (+) comp18693_c0_seq1:128-949(+)